MTNKESLSRLLDNIKSQVDNLNQDEIDEIFNDLNRYANADFDWAEDEAKFAGDLK